MRVSSGSSLIAAFGIVAGITWALPAAAQDELGAATEPVAIEIIGDPDKAQSSEPTDPTPEPPAKIAEEPAAGGLAPVAGSPLAATASTGGSGGTGPGTGSAEPQEKVDPFVGSFSTAVPIAVPPFHGIEPSLALTYNSSRGNGFVGVGWALSGLSVIERASPGRGAPRHDANDIFLLDGQELIECVAGTVSPSCDTGGSHATKVESYLRIKQDTTANTWEITGRDGTRTTYSAVMGLGTTVALDTYRWAMTSVVDTHGNTVTYSWWCDGTPAVECYPDTITYNGNTVRFYREARSDEMTYGAGFGLARIAHRLKTIDVLVGSDRSRAYRLSYVQSAGTMVSNLSAVQQYGTDAIVAGDGTVSSGTPLPPTALEQSGAAVPPAFHAVNDPNMFLNSTDSRNWTGDFDGDGITDLLAVSQTGEETAQVQVNLGSSSGAFDTVQHDGLSLNATAGLNKLGDFNGDGKTDILAVIAPAYGTPAQVYVNYATATGFQASRYENTGFTTWPEWLLTGDFNGDGMTDVLTPAFAGSTFLHFDIGYSNGNGFDVVRYTDAPLSSYHYWNFFKDFNGDGKTDILVPAFAGSTFLHFDIKYSTGDGFVTERYSNAPLSSYYYWNFFGDFNGDGKTDILVPTFAGSTFLHFDIKYSTGDGFVTEQYSNAPLSNYYYWNFFGDFNGDGKTDILVPTFAGSTFQYFDIKYATDSGFHTVRHHDAGMSNYHYRNEIGDFDGDGAHDVFAAISPTNSLSSIGKTSISDPSRDTVTAVTNPLGGTTTVDYAPSSAWTNQTLPMVLQTVSAITTDDGRGNTSTTSYAYEGGLWDAEERRFLGFRKATTTLPCIAGETQCPYSETTFRQDRASAGRMEQVDRFDGAGTLLTRGLEEYVVNDTIAPYTARNTASESHIIVGAVTRRTRVTRDFDDYGNVVEETAHGDADVLGDEITVATDYSPETVDYIVSLPARIRSFEGDGTTGTLLTESRIHYDDATDWATPPLRGDPTETQEWLDTESKFIPSRAEFDGFGNVTATIDPLNRRTEIDYETGFNLYPIAQRNPLYPTDNRHHTSTAWDTVCGVPTVVTDLNGNTTTTQYDALCRPIRTDLPDGGFTITGYNSIGDPMAQYVETQTPPADGSGNIWSRTYMDGFARPYRSTAKGPAAGQDITADTAYDDRGNVASQTAPYYTGDPVYTTTFDYDALDRPVATNHPDGNWTQTDYGVAGVFVSTTSTDELGHPVTLHLDAFGRAVRKEEPLGAATVKTDYTYDDLGRLTGIADDVENTWAYTHDSLGRTLTVDDPDLGVWTKTYDDAGQLQTQTDALTQVTRFTYDALGRMLTKTARDGTAQAELTTYVYDEAVAGFHNIGLLTRAENPSGILRYRYDQVGREAQRVYTIDGSDYTLASGFDIAGRLIWQDYPDGDTVGSALDPITYDAAGRLDAVPGLVTSATYDASGKADVFTRANGVVSTYGYSLTRGWLDSVVTTSGATSIQNMTYGRDDAGQITAVNSTFTDESWIYAYDALRRLLTATNTNNAAHSRTYTYDSIGNMLTNSGVTGTYSYPAAGSARPHAVTSVGSWTYTYDANGNMTAGAGRTYTYNGENRPTQIDTQAYTYGPDGERWKTVDSAPGGGTTLYLGGSIEIAAGVMTKYLPGAAKRVGSPGDPLVESFWLHHDHQGSIQAITDAMGAQVQRFTYYPYGDRIATATAHGETKGWIGERQDATGLFYLHARYYDPVIGRFVSADPSDPMAPGVGLNRYSYAFNTPIMRVDPLGLSSREEIDYYVERDKRRQDDRWESGRPARAEARDERDRVSMEKFGVPYARLGDGRFGRQARRYARAYAKYNLEFNAAPAMQDRGSTAYVGGFFDSTIGGPVKSNFEVFGVPGDEYFTWTEDIELGAWIDVNNNGVKKSRVTVIGHSYGADTAATVVASGHKVDRLITVDPVGWTRPDYARVAANSRAWANFNATVTGANFPDFIAGIGGAWNEGPRGYADKYGSAPHNHANICSGYCNFRT